jgi:peptide/nickel transport system permease protein
MLLLLIRGATFSLFSPVVVSAVLFVLTRSIPDSPARIVLGPDATDAQIVQFEHDNGLDRPVIVQYGVWLSDLLVRGDFGRSFCHRAIH